MSHRIERIGDCELHLGDTAEILPTLGRFDAVVTDPPYGINEAAGKNKSRGKLAISKDYGNDTWDKQAISRELMDAVKAAGRWQIIFGGNYYDSPPASCWLVWDKLNGDSDFADCELAWTNIPKAVRRLRFLWNGMLRAHGEPRGDHPTQKPVGVMKWCLGHIPIDGQFHVVDPFMGSGTTGVACVKAGLKFTGIERESKYFEAACRRIQEAYKQPDMFVSAPERKAEQLDLLGASE